MKKVKKTMSSNIIAPNHLEILPKVKHIETVILQEIGYTESFDMLVKDISWNLDCIDKNKSVNQIMPLWVEEMYSYVNMEYNRFP